jgi:hypothetical protein
VNKDNVSKEHRKSDIEGWDSRFAEVRRHERRNVEEGKKAMES